MTKSDSDLMVIAAALAHECGIDAVAPDEAKLKVIQQFAREQGKDLSLDTLKTALKRAQIELLHRQIDGRVNGK